MKLSLVIAGHFIPEEPSVCSFVEVKYSIQLYLHIKLWLTEKESTKVGKYNGIQRPKFCMKHRIIVNLPYSSTVSAIYNNN